MVKKPIQNPSQRPPSVNRAMQLSKPSTQPANAALKTYGDLLMQSGAVGRFGLKDAKTVESFLKSPAGNSVISRMRGRVAKEQLLKKDLDLQAHEKRVARHRLMAALFLWSIQKKAAASSKRAKDTRAYNAAVLQGAKAAPATSSKKLPNEELLQALKDYEKAIRLLMNHREVLQNDVGMLKGRLALLQSEVHGIEEKFEKYAADLDEFEKTMEALEQGDTPNEELLEKLATKANELEASPTKDEESTRLMRTLYQDARAVHRGEKRYVDKKGNDVKSYKDAHLALSPGDRILEGKGEKKGRYFLVRKGQDWDLAQNNPAELNSMEQAAKQGNGLQDVRQFFKSSKAQQLHSVNEQIKEVQESLASKEEELSQMDNQLEVLKENLAKTKTLLAASPAPKPAPGDDPKAALGTTPDLRPAPNSSPGLNPIPNPNLKSIPVPKPQPTPQDTATLAYQRELKSLRASQETAPGLSQKDLMTHFQKMGNNSNALKAVQYLETEFAKDALTKNPKIPKTGPIPKEVMGSLLENLERRANPEETKAAEEKKSTAPTPFKRSPL